MSTTTYPPISEWPADALAHLLADIATGTVTDRDGCPCYVVEPTCDRCHGNGELIGSEHWDGCICRECMTDDEARLLYDDPAVDAGVERALDRLGIGRWHYPEPCDDPAHGQAAVCGSCGATAGEEQGQ